MIKRYMPEQLIFLRDGYKSMNARDLAVAFNKKFCSSKTEGAIRATLKNHKIRCGRKGSDRLITHKKLFTGAQESFVRTHYKTHCIAGLTELFNNYFGTSRTQQQLKAFTSRYKILSGRTGQYSTGDKPWNNGTKGQGLTGPNKGSFRKGSIPANRKPLGSERISKDGFVEIKVAERNPHTGFPTRYRHKQRYIYEQEFGPVPDGMVVAFKDSDKTNCDPDNLMLISRAELLTLNRHGYREMPEELKPSVLALSKLQVKTRAMEKEA